MTKKTSNFRWVARIVAIIFAVCFAAFFGFAILFGTRPWPLSDQIVGGLSVLYIIGLLLGLKWPRIGGWLTLALPVFEIIHIVSSGGSIINAVVSIAYYLILTVPGMLYLLSWRLQEQERNHS